MRCKQENELSDGKPAKTFTIVTEDVIDTYRDSYEAKTSIGIPNIKQVVETRNYYFLITSARLSVVFKKDGFTKGTREEFEVFLQEKGMKK